MRRYYRVFAKRLFGADSGKPARMLLTDCIIFLGLRTAGLRLVIAPGMLYFMVGCFSAVAMWQALSSGENAADMQNLLMMPVKGRGLVPAYMAAFAAYTFVTQATMVLSVMFAVADWRPEEIVRCMSGVACAFLTCAGIFLARRFWPVCIIWAAAVLSFFFARESLWGWLFAANGIAALAVLFCADVYSIIMEDKPTGRSVKSHRHGLVWRYLFRYMEAHACYLANTFALWGLACALPFVFGQFAGPFILPIGFAILSMNTPVCTLLSCNPALEDAIRALPGAGKAFCVPYCLFLFTGNLFSNFLFLFSMQMQKSPVTTQAAVLAVFFSLFSAGFAVFLEWYFPIRGWKIESDIWRHPRKYIAPISVLLLAGAIASL